MSTSENLMPGESALPVVNVTESGPGGVAFDGPGSIHGHVLTAEGQAAARSEAGEKIR